MSFVAVVSCGREAAERMVPFVAPERCEER